MRARLADSVCLFEGLPDILVGFERWEAAWFEALPKCGQHIIEEFGQSLAERTVAYHISANGLRERRVIGQRGPLVCC